MRSTPGLWTLTLLLACGEPTSTHAEGPRDAPALPDVVLVSIDSLRRDHVGSEAARQAFEQLASSTRSALDFVAGRGTAPEQIELDAKMRETLESLGYLQH
jgi:hypothetical protein